MFLAPWTIPGNFLGNDHGPARIILKILLEKLACRKYN
jgi:hypothetical protein